MKEAKDILKEIEDVLEKAFNAQIFEYDFVPYIQGLNTSLIKNMVNDSDDRIKDFKIFLNDNSTSTNMNLDIRVMIDDESYINRITISKWKKV